MLRLLTILAIAAALPAQDPAVTQTYRSGGNLDLSLRYQASAWDPAGEEPLQLGQLRTRGPLSFGKQRVERGTHQLGLAERGGKASLIVKSTREGGATVECALSTRRAKLAADRVSLSLMPTDDAAVVVLAIGFGGKGASLEVSAAPRRGADDPALAKIHEHIKGLKIDRNDAEWKLKLSMPPRLAFTDGKKYLWHMVTNVGEITIELMPKVAPVHVSSTVFLAELGYYDNIAFHRVIPGFMAQGGCPLGNGRGHPGYKYNGEFDAAVTHDRHGLLSMANAGAGTDGSQFFLTFGPTRHLDGKHTIFGEVVGGKDAVDVLEQSGTRAGRPTRELVIEETYVTVE